MDIFASEDKEESKYLLIISASVSPQSFKSFSSCSSANSKSSKKG
jgi:hypothetical protein